MPRACAAGHSLLEEGLRIGRGQPARRARSGDAHSSAAKPTAAATIHDPQGRRLLLTSAVSPLAGVGAFERRSFVRPLAAHVIEQRVGRPAVELEAVGLLVGTDQGAG